MTELLSLQYFTNSKTWVLVYFHSLQNYTPSLLYFYSISFNNWLCSQIIIKKTNSRRQNTLTHQWIWAIRYLYYFILILIFWCQFRVFTFTLFVPPPLLNWNTLHIVSTDNVTLATQNFLEIFQMETSLGLNLLYIRKCIKRRGAKTSGETSNQSE